MVYIKANIIYIFQLIVWLVLNPIHSINAQPIPVPGLKSTMAYCLYQDDYGILWAGTANGLVRYNGSTIEIFQSNPEKNDALPDNWIRKIMKMDESHLLLLARNYIVQFNTRTYKSKELALFNSLDIAISDSLDIFCLSDSALLVLHPPYIHKEIIDLQAFSENQKSKKFRHLHWINNRLILSGNRILSLQIAAKEFHKEFEISPDALVKQVLPVDHKMLILTEKDLYQLNPESATLIPAVTKPVQPGSIIFQGKSQNDIIIFTPPDSLFSVSSVPGELKFTKTIENKFNSRINDIWYGKFGNLWMATTDHGILRFPENDAGFNLYAGLEKLQDLSVTGIFKDTLDHTWFGTFNGEILEHNPISKKISYIGNVPSKSQVFGFSEYKDSIYAFSWNGEIQSISKTTGKFSVRKITGEKAVMRGLSCDSLDNTFIGTYDGIMVLHHPDNSLKHFPARSLGIQGQRTTSVLVNSTELWIGSEDHLSKFLIQYHGNQVVDLTIQPLHGDLKSGYHIYCLGRNSRGNIWAGTYGNGAYLLNSDAAVLTHLSTGNSLPDNIVSAVFEDSLSRVWIAYTGGIGTYNPETKSFHNRYIPREVIEFNWGAGYQAEDGEILLGSTKGPVSFKPADFKINTHFPICRISSVRMETLSLPSENNLQDVHFVPTFKVIGKSGIEININLTYFDDPENCKGAVRIEGSNTNWITWKGADFTFLPDISQSGTYAIWTKSQNSDGLWGPERITGYLDITLPLFPFKSVIVIILLLISGSLGFLLRRKTMRQRKYADGSQNQDEFIKKLENYIHEHMDDHDLNVQQLSRYAGISRSMLHIRLKEKLNLSPGDFIRNIRLTEAEKLLKEGKHTIKEVTFMTGFNDASYFTKCFKSHFGKLPSEI